MKQKSYISLQTITDDHGVIRKTSVPDLDLIDATRMKKRFGYGQKIQEDLRKRFRTEYFDILQAIKKKLN